MTRCLLILVLFFGHFSVLTAEVRQLTSLPVSRLTRQGSNLLFESGFFTAPSGEVTLNFRALVPVDILGDTDLTPAVIARVEGRLLADKNHIEGFRKKHGDAYLAAYRFSRKSYPADPYGLDCYLVTLAPAADAVIPTASVRASTPRLKEGPKRSATFDITLDRPATANLPIFFGFSGTAKIGPDYVAGNTGSVIIRKGKKTAQVRITLKNDTVREPKEGLTLSLQYHPSYNRARTTSSIITITDNDK